MSQPDLKRPLVDVEGGLASVAKRARRQAISWLLAGVLVIAAMLALDSSDAGIIRSMVIGVFTLMFVGWSARMVVGLQLALRDFREAATEPRRAFVVLLNDVHPRSSRFWRPLLAIWSQPPPSGGQLSKPDQVYRCDEGLGELVTWAGSVRVHEAWVDTGPRPSSKPRWVAADGGIAVPHRRALFGRSYAFLL